MRLASTILLEEKALQGCANASQGHSNPIVVSKVLVLQREDQYGFILHQVLIMEWPV